MHLDKKSKILKIYISDDSKYNHQNLYHAIVRKMAEIGMAGVTVTRGIEGFGHEKRVRSSSILDISLKLPVVIEVIDSEDRILAAAEIIKEMVNEGLIIMTDVEVIKYGNKYS